MPASTPPPRPRSAGCEAKLVCTAGPKAGTEFPLAGEEEIFLGRATDNVISIPDTSVSRKHCSVRKLEDGWAISDLGSGNGTLVNGERVEGEAILRNGDVITIGDTELSFADVENATDRRPPPVRRTGTDLPARRSVPGRPDVRARLTRTGAPAAANPGRKRKLVLLGGLGLVVVLGGLVAGVMVKKKNQEREAALRAAKAERVEAVRSVVQEGKNLILEGKWEEAKAKFEEVKAAAPNFPGVDDYLARATVEIPNGEHLGKAEEALAQNQLAAAAQSLAAVSKDTQQIERVRKLKAQLDQKLGDRLRDASALLAASGSKEEKLAAAAQAQEITADILQMDPDHRDAQVVHENGKKLIAQLNYVAPPPPPEPKRPWIAVQHRYAAGDLTGALALSDECAGGFKPCRELGKDMREFAKLYKKVESLDARGLTKLLALDKEISDGKGSPMGRTAGTRAASIFYKNASGAKNAGQWGKAIDWATRCTGADPGNAGCRAIVEEVRGKSKEEYLRCYTLKDQSPDEAVPCFRGVMQMSARGDENYEKAEKWVEKLSSR